MYKKHKDVLKDDCSSDIPTIEDINGDGAELTEIESSSGQSDLQYDYKAVKYILKTKKERN